jgi:hypothetical protein
MAATPFMPFGAPAAWLQALPFQRSTPFGPTVQALSSADAETARSWPTSGLATVRQVGVQMTGTVGLAVLVAVAVALTPGGGVMVAVAVVPGGEVAVAVGLAPPEGLVGVGEPPTPGSSPFATIMSWSPERESFQAM